MKGLQQLLDEEKLDLAKLSEHLLRGPVGSNLTPTEKSWECYSCGYDTTSEEDADLHARACDSW